METILVGAGNIGKAIAHYFSKVLQQEITIIDSNLSALENLNLDKNLVKLNHRNIFDDAVYEQLAKNKGLIISTLPWPSHLELCQSLENLPLTIIGIARPDYAYYQNLLGNKRKIQARIIQGCGLEPGLSELFAQYLASHFSQIEDLFIACGGIPAQPVPPMDYRLTFGNNHLPFQQKECLKISQGKLCFVSRFSEVEELILPTLGHFECWNEGLTPWLAHYLFQRRISNCRQKTIRWPGYSKIVEFLNQSGFLSYNPIQHQGEKFTPLSFTEKLLLPQLQLDKAEIDLVIQHLQASGLIRNKEFKIAMQLIDLKDKDQDLSAMARTTGFSTVLMANFLQKMLSFSSGEFMITDFYSADLIKYLLRNLRKAGMKISFLKP